MKFTTNKLAEITNTKRDAAYALMVYLKAAGLAQEAGTVEKPAGAKGRAESLYEIDLSSVAEHFKKLGEK